MRNLLERGWLCPTGPEVSFCKMLENRTRVLTVCVNTASRKRESICSFFFFSGWVQRPWYPHKFYNPEGNRHPKGGTDTAQYCWLPRGPNKLLTNCSLREHFLLKDSISKASATTGLRTQLTLLFTLASALEEQTLALPHLFTPPSTHHTPLL